MQAVTVTHAPLTATESPIFTSDTTSGARTSSLAPPPLRRTRTTVPMLSTIPVNKSAPWVGLDFEIRADVANTADPQLAGVGDGGSHQCCDRARSSAPEKLRRDVEDES